MVSKRTRWWTWTPTPWRAWHRPPAAAPSPLPGDEPHARPVSSENKAHGTRDKYAVAHCVSFPPITASSSPLVTGWVLRFSAAFKARSWRTGGLYDLQRNSDGLKLTMRYCPQLSHEPATSSVLRHKTHDKEQQTREGKPVERNVNKIKAAVQPAISNESTGSTSGLLIPLRHFLRFSHTFLTICDTGISC